MSGEGDCLAAKLRPGNVHSAEDWAELLLPEIEQSPGRIPSCSHLTAIVRRFRETYTTPRKAEVMKINWISRHFCILSCCVLACLAGRPLTAQVSTSQSFRVFDANNRLVGLVVGVAQGTGVTTVVINTAQGWLPVYVQRSIFQTGSLEYTSFDCTGQAYASANSSPFLISAVLPVKNLLYGQNGNDQVVEVNSFTDGQSGMCIQSSFEDPDAVPMTSVLDLNVFKPPFKVVPAPL